MSNFQERANFIWQVADDILRGVFKNYEYGDVVLPFTVLRLDCVLRPTKDAVIQIHAQFKTQLPEDQLSLILNLHEDISHLFELGHATALKNLVVDYACEESSGHGRHERRQC